MSLVPEDVAKERQRQIRIWGVEMHDDGHTQNDWAALIMFQLAKSVALPFDTAVFRRRMIQVAAMAQAAAEAVDRGAVVDASQRGRG